LTLRFAFAKGRVFSRLAEGDRVIHQTIKDRFMTLTQRVAPFVAALLLAGAAGASPLQSLHFKTVIRKEMPGHPTQSLRGETWIKNGKVRRVIGNTVDIIDGAHEYRYLLQDKQKRYIEGPPLPALKARSTVELLKQYFTPPSDIAKKKIGTATLLGHSVDVYSISNPKNSAQNLKIWLANDLGAPLSVKQVLKDKKASLTTEITSLEINPKVADSLFSIPKGYRKIETPHSPAKPGTGKTKTKPAPHRQK
jgi:hypothetical protein